MGEGEQMSGLSEWWSALIYQSKRFIHINLIICNMYPNSPIKVLFLFWFWIVDGHCNLIIIIIWDAHCKWPHNLE